MFLEIFFGILRGFLSPPKVEKLQDSEVLGVLGGLRFSFTLLDLWCLFLACLPFTPVIPRFHQWHVISTSPGDISTSHGPLMEVSVS